MTKSAPMPRRTLAALKASIAKWEKLATDGYTSSTMLGTSTCPLCRLFIISDLGRNASSANVFAALKSECDGCPVFAKTGKHYCEKTPYWRAANAFRVRKPEVFKAAARREADFLKSLLPKKGGAK